MEVYFLKVSVAAFENMHENNFYSNNTAQTKNIFLFK